MPTATWTFKSYFLRREAYGWIGTVKSSQRMNESASEFKKVAKTDSSLAAVGAIELFIRLCSVKRIP